jgi:hypothetical protein
MLNDFLYAQGLFICSMTFYMLNDFLSDQRHFNAVNKLLKTEKVFVCSLFSIFKIVTLYIVFCKF